MKDLQENERKHMANGRLERIEFRKNGVSQSGGSERSGLIGSEANQLEAIIRARIRRPNGGSMEAVIRMPIDWKRLLGCHPLDSMGS